MKVKYKGNYIINDEQTTHKLLTSGKYCEDDFEIEAQGGGGGDVSVIPIQITASGNYKAPQGYAYDPIDVDNPLLKIGIHTDDNGIWHKPNDWDDIESMTFGANDSVLYYLIDPHAYDDAYFCLRVYGTSLKYAIGRVNNGVFTEIEAETTISSGGYIERNDIDTLYANQDYIVVKITGNPINYCTLTAKRTDPKIPAINMPILMRYGNLPSATTTASTISNGFIESDNIVNYWSNKTNTKVSLASFYASCYRLQRVRIGGWNIENQLVSSFSSMFSACYSLSDIDTLDFSNWVKSNCTTVASMFSNCMSLKGRLNVSNWDMSAITTCASTFTYCYSLDYIDGLETWNALDKCTRTDSMFSYCQSLRTEIDISRWQLGNGSVDYNNISSMFSYCFRVPKIIFKNVDLSKCPSLASLFSYCRSLQEIEWDNITPITSVCTSCSGMFSYDQSLEYLPTDFDGWDFTNATVLSMFYTCTNLRRIEISANATPTTLSMTDGSSSTVYGACYNAEYIDVRHLFNNYSQFTSTYMHSGVSTTTFTHLRTLLIPNGLYKATTCQGYSLDKDSLINVMNSLVDRTGQSSLKLTIGSINLAKLSASEKAIATNKNWTLA